MEQKSQKSFYAIGLIVLAIIVLAGLLLVKGNQKLSKSSPATVSSASVTVGNTAPVASNAILNDGGDITLTEGTTKSVAASSTVTDNNSCQDLVSVNIAVYKDGSACAVSGDANNDTCYFYTDTNPASSTSCSGPSDTTYVINHSFDIQYYADGGTWKTTITPSDTELGTAATSSGVTLNDLQALAVTPTLAYGSVNNGATSTGDHTITTENTGNVAIDFDLSGANLACATYGTIPVGNEQYSLSSFSYGAGTALATSTASVNGDLGSPAYNTVPVTDLSYWQVSVPSGVKGVCSGNITFAVKPAVVISVAIGDSYQGGIVAYILQSGDPGYDPEVERGFIAATEDQSTGIYWAANATEVDAIDPVVGAGNTNTNTIVSARGTESNAAKLCSDLVLGGYSDWYLPSRNELNKLYTNRVIIGGFSTGTYWSSTEYNGAGWGFAWAQDFDGTGSQHSPTKDGTNNVRCARSF